MSREQVERPITGLSGKDKFKYIYVAIDETERLICLRVGVGTKRKRTTWEVKDSKTRRKSDSRERPVTFLVVSMARGYYWDRPWSGGTEKPQTLQAEVHSSSLRQIKTARVCGAASVVDEVHSPGANVPSAVRRVVIHAVEQNAVHLRYVLRAQTGVWGALSANTRLHTHSDRRWRGVTD